MPSELLSSITGGGGAGVIPFPALPSPLFDDGYVSFTTNRIPHKGALVDNIQIPSTFTASGTGAIVGLLGEVTVWTVNPTDVNAACDGFLGIQTCWYDSVNDRLYVFGLDTGTAPATYYLAYITIETGAVTNVGSAQFTTNPADQTQNLHINLQRAAIDSGNFTILSNDRTIVVNESTGAEVSNVASTNTVAGVDVGTYSTLDGTLLLNRIANDNNESSGLIELTKSSQSLKTPIPQPNVAYANAATVINVLPWGDKVKLLGSTTVVTTAGITRSFNRSQFDAWLQDVAKFGGVS